MYMLGLVLLLLLLFSFLKVTKVPDSVTQMKVTHLNIHSPRIILEPIIQLENKEGKQRVVGTMQFQLSGWLLQQKEEGGVGGGRRRKGGRIKHLLVVQLPSLVTGNWK